MDCLSSRHKNELKSEYLKVSYLYLSSRNCFNLGWLPYSYFRNLIRYASGENNQRVIRNVFDNLVAQGVIHRDYLNGSTKYLFNPHNKIYNKKYIIEWI